MTETIHDGPRFTAKRGQFGDKTREWVEAPDAVGVVAYDDEHIYLVTQMREAIGRDDIPELPAGLMDVEGEEPLDTGKRELREEIGMEAAEWSHAASFFSSSGFTDEEVHVFLATGLEQVGEPEEGLEVVRWPLAKLDDLIEQNRDAKTLIGLLHLRRTRG